MHQPVKFGRNRAIGGEVLTSYSFLRWRQHNRKSTFGNGARLGRWKSDGIPNFDEICQSKAEIKILPVSENRRPPFWNSFSVLCFAYFSSSALACQISSKSNYPWRSYDVISIFFLKMAAGSNIGLIWIILDHPRSAIVGLRLVLTFGLDRIYSFGDIAMFIFSVLA